MEERMLLDADGTTYVGDRIIVRTGDGLYGNIPAPVARVLGVEPGQEIRIHVNKERGAVIHELVDDE
jgi:hypothetical protein